MFSIDITISKDIYNVNTNYKSIPIDNLDVKKIYTDFIFLNNLPLLKLDDKLLLEKFPLLQLINCNNLYWKKYNFDNILNITDLTLEDLNFKENLDFLNKQAIVMRYFFNKFDTNGDKKLILFLTLVDFCLKTIKINNKKLNLTIKDKIKKDKDRLLDIIDENLFNKIYEIFEENSK
jgi:hypothetical protein